MLAAQLAQAGLQLGGGLAAQAAALGGVFEALVAGVRDPAGEPHRAAREVLLAVGARLGAHLRGHGQVAGHRRAQRGAQGRGRVVGLGCG